MSTTYTYVVIDDDNFARETLLDLLAEIPHLKLLKTISESGMAIKYLATLKPDLVFLDINMPNKSGIDIQKEIMDLQLSSKVIFTTAHEEYVVEAFKNNAFDYLIKPIRKKELLETLARFYARMSEIPGQNHEVHPSENVLARKDIVLNNAYGVLILPADDIFYIEADGAYSVIHLTNGKSELISKNLGKIEHLFQHASFFKISRSNIINTKYLMRTDRLNKKVALQYKDLTVQLKVSRERLYDLEHQVYSKRTNAPRS